MDTIISLSGGMDSTTLLAVAIQEGRSCLTIGFTYGSKHNQFENEAARLVSQYYEIPFRLIDFSSVSTHFKSDLLSSGGEIPEGHYEASNMKQTVVPGRNMVFASILAGIAWTEGVGEVWLGIHSGDHAIYPDCRPDFFKAMDSAVIHGTDKRVCLKAPFLEMNKISILARGKQLEVPYWLTRTCYKAQSIACGKCGACQERLEAFRINGMDDPVEYER